MKDRKGIVRLGLKERDTGDLFQAAHRCLKNMLLQFNGMKEVLKCRKRQDFDWHLYCRNAPVLVNLSLLGVSSSCIALSSCCSKSSPGFTLTKGGLESLCFPSLVHVL